MLFLTRIPYLLARIRKNVLTAQYGHVETVKMLLAKGAQVDLYNHNGSTAIMLACHQGRTDVVIALLAAAANLHIKDKDGNTAVMMACKHIHLNLIKTIFSHSSSGHRDLLSARNALGQSPLHIAAISGNCATAKILCDNGADVEAKDDKGNTPLILASEAGFIDVCELLLRPPCSADWQKTNKKGETALCIAKGNNHVAVTKLIDQFASTSR